MVESIKSDCSLAKDHFISRERIEHIDLAQALTLNDVGTLASGDTLPTYDAMILHGDEIEDKRFIEDLMKRLESVGLKGNVYRFMTCFDCFLLLGISRD